MKYYKGTHVVKREVIDGNIIDTYVSFKDGVIFLQTYINCVFNGETVIADINCGFNGETVIANLSREVNK